MGQYSIKRDRDLYKVSNHESFDRDGYLFVPEFFTDVGQIAAPPPKERGRIDFIDSRRYTFDPDETQVDGCWGRYNFPAYKSIHYSLMRKIENILQIDLHPTYYYERYYFVGQELKRHNDRPSCEISVSLQIGTNSQTPWPIWFEKPDGTMSSVTMKTGDAVIYKGRAVDHWRHPLKSKYNKFEKGLMKIMNKKDDTYHHQIFFHYVNANGPYVEYAFDAIKDEK